MSIIIDENNIVCDTEPLVSDWYEHAVEQWFMDSIPENMCKMLKEEVRDLAVLNYVGNCLMQSIADGELSVECQRKYAFEAMKIIRAYIKKKEE